MQNTNYSYIIDKQNKNTRLDIFLQQKHKDLTRSYLKTLIEKEQIKVNGGKVKSGYSLKENDQIQVNLPQPKPTQILPENIPLDILFEDDHLAVINKPQNMIVHPTKNLTSGTLVNALLFHMKNLSGINGNLRPGIVHRIDKDTSGLIVIAKDDITHKELQKQIQNKTCHRTYLALAYGKFSNSEGRIENNLARGKSQHEKIFVVPKGQGRIAITDYTVKSYNSGFSFVEFRLLTGRTHQIRVHASNMGHPIVGDKLYGKPNEKFALAGQLLHAYKLEFIHPISKTPLSFTAPLPPYFSSFLQNYNLI